MKRFALALRLAFIHVWLSMAEPVLSSERRVFWVYGRQADCMRYGSGLNLAAGDIYTKFVRAELIRGNMLPAGVDLPLVASGSAWSAPFRHLAQKVLGLIVCRPASLNSLLLYLGRQQRHIQDFWQLTPFYSHSTFFFEILDSCSLEEFVSVYTNMPGIAPRGTFSR